MHLGSLRLVAAAALVAAAPAVASANGRFPESIDVHFQPGNDQRIALQATWGLIVSDDDGATWSWICEEAVGFSGVYDPDYAFTSSGLLLATTLVEGLRLTRDFCTWSPAPAPLGPAGGDDQAEFASQVEVAADGTIYVTAPYDGGYLYRSDDDAASFTRIDVQPDPATDWWESLAVTTLPGGAHRLYLTGFDLTVGGDKRHLLLRSDDGGASWTPLPLDAFEIGDPGGELHVAAISPTDPDLVFARVYQVNGMSLGDALYRSDDAGQSWAKVFEIGDDITAVAVRASGDVYVATRQSDAFRSTDGGVTFGPAIDSPTLNCLREREGGVLYACSRTLPPDGMLLGRGATFGTWDVILNHADVTAPVHCADGTVQKDVCEDERWEFVNCQYALGDPDINCNPVDGAVPDAGLVVDEDPKGCCSASGGPAAVALLTILVAAPLLRTRRRR